MEHLRDTPTGPRDYAALNLTWAVLMGGLLAGTAGRGADAPARGELPVIGLATFALSKALTKEKVGVWIRVPVAERGPDGERHPKGTGLRYALGELLTCARCVGSWSSLGLVGLRVARPREGRIVSSVLAVAAMNDVLQAGFAFAASKANATEAGAQLAGIEARDARAHAAASGDGGIG